MQAFIYIHERWSGGGLITPLQRGFGDLIYFGINTVINILVKISSISLCPRSYDLFCFHLIIIDID